MKTINLNATVKTKCFNGKYDETMWFLMAVEGDIIEVETAEGMEQISPLQFKFIISLLVGFMN
ncbi:conserved hypothetical protein [EscherichiaphageJS98] [Escherichia phage vB_Eco_NR1]|nr:conserved hypothetical protein [EscherichiaphageJS98] [Escherichia phage vB_Eco_NR1]